MGSAVAGESRARPSGAPSRAYPSSRGQAGEGLLLHGPLPLDGHLEVVWQGLPTSQHLIGHDLGPQLLQLGLVERGGTGGAPGTPRPTWTHGYQARSQAGSTGAQARSTGAQAGSGVGSRAGAARGSSSVVGTAALWISAGAVQGGEARARAGERRGGG